MAKVTSKLQVTVPKAIADQFRIRPGDEIEWLAAGEAIRVVPQGRRRTLESVAARLKLFDEATARQSRRRTGRPKSRANRDRGWKREDLYDLGRAR